jgi:hypothetical protein
MDQRPIKQPTLQRIRADTNTRWSLVAAAKGRDAGVALAELCSRYWCAVYAFLRRCDHPPHIAQELATGFFRRLVRERLQQASPETCGRFREFVLAQLKRDLDEAWRSLRYDPDVDGVRSPLPVEILEDRFLADCNDRDTPEQAYEKSFSHAVIARSFERLRAEAERNGRLPIYRKIEPFLRLEPSEGEAEKVSVASGLRPLAALLALRSLRQRLREVVNEEIGDTVADLADVGHEMRTLRISMPG